MPLTNNDQKLVELLALRATLPAEQALELRLIPALLCRRLTLRSATGFSQRENHHRYLPKT